MRNHSTGRNLAGRRRGNALIMAVAMTVLLAIIGSTFVIMARMDRQAVRNVQQVQTVDVAVDNVLQRIQEQLARDIVTTGSPVVLGGDGSPARPNEPYDWPGSTDSWLASLEPVMGSNGVIGWMQTSKLDGSASGALQARVAVNIPFDPDGKIIPIPDATATADADGDGITDSVWFELKDVIVEGNKKAFAAVRIIDNCGMVNVQTAWDRYDKNSNAMVTWARRPNAASGLIEMQYQQDSYGEFLHQVSLSRLLARQGLGLEPPSYPLLDKAGLLRRAWYQANNIQNGRFLPTSNLPLFLLDMADPAWEACSQLFSDSVIRDYGWFSYFAPSTDNSFHRYGIEDELELRTRFFLNGPDPMRIEGRSNGGPSELVLWDSIGRTTPGDIVPASDYRRMPYAIDPSNPDTGIFKGMDTEAKVISRWYKQLTDDPELNNGAPPAKRVPADQRHLITTYSFDREIRSHNRIFPPTKQGLVPDIVLDTPGWVNSGKFRKVNVNQVLTDWMNNDGSQNAVVKANLAVMRMGLAFDAAGYYPNYQGTSASLAYPGNRVCVPNTDIEKSENLNQGIQFMVNLVDYVDGDTNPTIIPANSIYPDWNVPSRTIIGTERQPFISEVYQKTGAMGNVIATAVELYNPYDKKIVASPVATTNDYWELRYGKNMSFPLVNGDPESAFPPVDTAFTTGGRAVCANGVSVTGATMFSVAGLKFEKADSLYLVRTVTGPDGKRYTIVMDAVPETIMASLIPEKDKTKECSLQRGGRGWEWARAKFVSKPSHKLGQDKPPLTPTTPDNLGFAEGMAIPITNRGPLMNNAGLGPSLWWQVNGWAELGRVLTIGNPDWSTVETSNDPPTISQQIDRAFDKLSEPDINDREPEGYARINFSGCIDSNKNGKRDSGEPVSRGKLLMDQISLVSRADDGIDNDNADDDSNWEGEPNPFTAVNDGVTTGADDLMECRIPGRLNLNTMSRAVFRAIVPTLALFDRTTLLADGKRTEFEYFMDDLANKFIVRQREAPFTSVGDFLNWLKAQENKYFWVSHWPNQNTAIYPDGKIRPDRDVGDPRMSFQYNTLDFEERDWLFTRMANLLTVRSDTFTAYILVRIKGENENQSDISERRVMAIIDRSNVFLPTDKAIFMPKGTKIFTPKGDAEIILPEDQMVSLNQPWPFKDDNEDGKWIGSKEKEPYARWEDSNNDGIFLESEFIPAGWATHYTLLDASGEMFRYMCDRVRAIEADPTAANRMTDYSPLGRNDVSYFDRQLTWPKIVAMREVRPIK